MVDANKQEPKKDMVVAPFLKWPGGKRWLAPKVATIIRRYLMRRYYEPFVGGGAVFFYLRPKAATLADINPDLINVYRVVRDHPVDLIDRIRAMPVCEEFYYALRNRKCQSSQRRAAKLLYLNRTGFAGMYRLNSRGEFNVPYGGGERTTAILWERNLIMRASEILQCARLRVADFARMMASAGPGDVVYCDPTYTVAHDNNGFVRYNERNFSWSDQLRLAACSRRAVRRGATVIISNAHHRCIKQLYEGERPHLLKRRSLVSRDQSKRRQVCEYLFVLLPKPKG